MKQKTWFNYLSALLPVILWALMIYLFSDQEVLPGFSLSLWDFLLKKSAHVFVYAVLYTLLARALMIIKKKKFQHIWWQALLLSIAYAVSDELHQSTVAGRSATARDVGFDTLGASLVLLKRFDYI